MWECESEFNDPKKEEKKQQRRVCISKILFLHSLCAFLQFLAWKQSYFLSFFWQRKNITREEVLKWIQLTFRDWVSFQNTFNSPETLHTKYIYVSVNTNSRKFFAMQDETYLQIRPPLKSQYNSQLYASQLMKSSADSLIMNSPILLENDFYFWTKLKTDTYLPWYISN